MKLLMFLAKQFTFRPFEQTLPDAGDGGSEVQVASAAARLRNTGYQVVLTPFGWVCEWELSVHGESLAKVFKSL